MCINHGGPSPCPEVFQPDGMLPARQPLLGLAPSHTPATCPVDSHLSSRLRTWLSRSVFKQGLGVLGVSLSRLIRSPKKYYFSSLHGRGAAL